MAFYSNSKSIILNSMGTTVTILYDQTEYRGNIKEGVPSGNGTVTFKDGSIIEGDFVDGQLKKGKVQCQDYRYEGQFSGGEISGVGKLIDDRNTLYEGQFSKGRCVKGTVVKRSEKGEVIAEFTGVLSSGNERQGTLLLRMREEQGNLVKDNRRLQGSFIRGKLSQQGKYTFECGDVYEGQFKQGKRHGVGAYKNEKLSISCCFQGDRVNGQATIQFSNGDRYEGNTKDGQFNGWGKYQFKNGTVYEGDFYCGSMWGKCHISFPVGGQIESYQGEVADGQFCGIGTLFYSNGVIYKGFFQKGAKNGYGALIYCGSKFKCLYMMNELVGELRLMQ